MTDIELPVDTGRSRINNRGRSTVTDESENPDDITTLDQKILAFRLDHPKGVIDTRVTETFVDDVSRFTVRASVWREWASGKPADSTGHATRVEGIGNEIEANYSQETAESIAISRALRFLGIGHRPDIEEA